MKRSITIEEDDVRILFEQDPENPFKWRMSHWHDDHYGPPSGYEFDGRDMLWQCAATIGVGDIARRFKIGK